MDYDKHGRLALALGFILATNSWPPLPLEAQRQDATRHSESQATVAQQRTDNYLERADSQLSSQQYSSAALSYASASSIFAKQGLWREYLLCKIKECQCLKQMNRLDEAISALQLAIETASSNYTHVDDALPDALKNLGLLHYRKNDYDSTLRCWKKALALEESIFGENHERVAKTCSNIGVVYDSQSNYDSALDYLLRALTIFETVLGADHSSLVGVCNNIANVYREQYQYSQSLKYFSRALAICKATLGEGHSSAAKIYNNIGLVYFNQDEHTLALEYLVKALTLKMANLGEDHTSLAETYNNIAAVKSSTEHYDEALQNYQMALTIYRNQLGDDHRHVAKSYNNIGTVYDDIHKYDLALENYFNALEIYQSLDESINCAASYDNIGIVYRKQSKNEESLAFFIHAMNKRTELLGVDHPQLAKSYNHIASHFKSESQPFLALTYLQKALCVNLPEFDACTDIYANPILSECFDYGDLIATFRRRAELFAMLAQPDARGVDGVQVEEPDFLLLALRNYQLCDDVIAKARMSPTQKDDKIAVGETAYEVYEGAMSTCLDLGARESSSVVDQGSLPNLEELAFYFSEQNRAAVLLQALDHADALNFSGLPDSLVQREATLQARIASLRLKIAEDPPHADEMAFRDKLFQLNREYEGLIATFEEQHPEYFELKYSRSSPTIAELSGSLDDDTAVVSYSVGRESIFAFLVTRNDFRVLRIARPDNFDVGVRRWRGHLVHGDTYSQADRSRRYYDLLMRPIEELIDSQPQVVRNLVIIPDGILAYVPFEALIAERPETGARELEEIPYLIRRYVISYSYSASLLLRTLRGADDGQKTAQVPRKFVAFAPVFSEDEEPGPVTGSGMYAAMEPLPSTEDEVTWIRDLFQQLDSQAMIHTLGDATEGCLKTSHLTDFGYIHFATHAIVDEEKPELSGIVLAQDPSSTEDGTLHSGEIYSLRMNAELVVLSACETGLGRIVQGEGIMGLTRGFIYAGAENLVVSLWRVADRSTARLMVEFYRSMLESGGKAESLREAKLKMIESGRFASAYYWAPFVLLGR